MSSDPNFGGGANPGWTRGDCLRRAREWAGMSQEEVGAALDISRRSISSYESNVRQPKRSVLIAWAMATGVSLGFLEAGEVPAPRPPVPPVGLEPTTCGLQERNP
ncbi:helix-turn-helix domain-containing protein [Rhodococcoides fascians]|uniref:helix-turn-helix domain-containing protein n=1 Tax=Rhodococcoides fascians TaxID=1828 RepID=UPI0009B8A7A2|nr:helix-turn-helix transcriptional regulator [Rhodococcus fascians]